VPCQGFRVASTASVPRSLLRSLGGASVRLPTTVGSDPVRWADPSIFSAVCRALRIGAYFAQQGAGKEVDPDVKTDAKVGSSWDERREHEVKRDNKVTPRRNESMRVAFALVCVVCVALAGWTDAHAAVCVVKTKKGVIKKVTIREACAKKETAVPASDLLQQGPHVIDSGGKEVGALQSGDTVLRQVGDKFVTFSVNSQGIVTPVSDSQYGFTYQGSQCTGTPYSQDVSTVDDNALSFDVSVSADGKTGYYAMSSETAKLSGNLAQAYFVSECVTPPGTPVTATCGSSDTALGPAHSCDPKKLGQDPTAQCSCIDCCGTFTITAPGTFTTYPVHTVDLSGVGTPPFKVER